MPIRTRRFALRYGRAPSQRELAQLAQASDLTTRKSKEGALDAGQLHADWAGKLRAQPGVPLAQVAPSVWHADPGLTDPRERVRAGSRAGRVGAELRGAAGGGTGATGEKHRRLAAISLGSVGRISARVAPQVDLNIRAPRPPLPREHPVRNRVLDMALDCVQCGWFVLPCQPGQKAPVTRHGCLDARSWNGSTATRRGSWPSSPAPRARRPRYRLPRPCGQWVPRPGTAVRGRGGLPLRSIKVVLSGPPESALTLN